MGLPPGYEIETVRGASPESLADELAEFWSRSDALASEQARPPLTDVVCALRDGDGRIQGVNSVKAQAMPFLGDRPYWLYRAFLASGGDELHAPLVIAARAELDREFLASDGSGPIGLCLLVSDGGLLRRHPEAVWRETDLTYAGYTPEGLQVRVGYFQGARVSPSKLSPAETVTARVDEPAREERRLDERFELQLFADSPVSKQDIIDLWVGEEAMPLEVAEERVEQVLFVAVERSSGRPVGLCTSYPGHVEQLRLDLWLYRTFIAKAHRDSDVARHLLYVAMDRLEGRFASGEDTRAPGMIFALENELLKKVRNEARWPTTHFLFIGETDRGAHIRVRWFDGAEAPPPMGSTGYA